MVCVAAAKSRAEPPTCIGPTGEEAEGRLRRHGQQLGIVSPEAIAMPGPTRHTAGSIGGVCHMLDDKLSSEPSAELLLCKRAVFWA